MDQLIDKIAAIDSGVDQFEYKGVKYNEFQTIDGIITYYQEELSKTANLENETYKKALEGIIEIFVEHKVEDKNKKN